MTVVDDLVELLVGLAVLVPELLGQVQPLVVLDGEQLDHLVAECPLVADFVCLLLHQRKGHAGEGLDVALLSRGKGLQKPL